MADFQKNLYLNVPLSWMTEIETSIGGEYPQMGHIKIQKLTFRMWLADYSNGRCCRQGLVQVSFILSGLYAEGKVTITDTIATLNWMRAIDDAL